MSRYLTAGDLTSRPPGVETVAQTLQAVPAEAALAWVARHLGPGGLGGQWREHQLAQARDWLDSSTPRGRQALDLVLTGQRILLAPQVLLVLARLAVVHGQTSGGTALPADAERHLRQAMLVLAHHMGAERRASDAAHTGPDRKVRVGGADVTALEVGLVANQLVNRRPFPASVFDRFARRWLEIPAEASGQPQAVDLPALYGTATGVPLQDLSMIAVTLWAAAIGDTGPHVGPGHLDDLGLGRDRTERAVALISDTAQGLVARSAEAPSALDPEYDMSLFGQTPVVRLEDGGLLVVSPVLLLERVFGWLPYFDMKQALSTAGGDGRKQAARAETYLRRTTEAHAVETLRHAAAAGRATEGLYDGPAIQAAYGTGSRNADTAAGWPGAWVVSEISSRQVTRGTAGAASANDLLDDLNRGVVEKAEQLDATIKALRADEARLTGRAAAGPRRFWPVLVTTEGFPANPLTVRRVRRMVREAGFLTAADTAGLVILDTEAVEAVETVAEQGGPSWPELLAAHAASDMAEYGFKEWLLITRATLRPPVRVMQRWDRVFAPAVAALKASSGPEAD